MTSNDGMLFMPTAFFFGMLLLAAFIGALVTAFFTIGTSSDDPKEARRG